MLQHREQVVKAKANRKRLEKAISVSPDSAEESAEKLRLHQYYGQRRSLQAAGIPTAQAEDFLHSQRQAIMQQRLSALEHQSNPERNENPDLGPMSGNPDVRMDEPGYGIETGQPSAKIPNDRGASGSSGVYRRAIGKLEKVVE